MLQYNQIQSLNLTSAVGSKKTILHIIQNFGRGGAETAVVGVLKQLTEYNNIVVTLDNLNEFGDELTYDKYFSLDLKSYYLFPMAIRRLRKIIINNKVDLVHSQLYWSTILARFACPKHIPLVTSIQASLTGSVEYKKKWIGALDRFSYNWRESVILGVSRHTLDDYFSFLHLVPKQHHVLYNFVDTQQFFAATLQDKRKYSTFKLIAVGNLKIQKNHMYLLKAMLLLKDEDISLDIYGNGELEETLASFIRENDLPVRLMGKRAKIQEVMAEYDLFVMPSLYEGFSLAVLEGMVMEKPMLLSDTPTFREQCADTANYFSLDNVEDLARKILALKTDPLKLRRLAVGGRNRALQYFTLDQHMITLRRIYLEVLANWNNRKGT